MRVTGGDLMSGGSVTVGTNQDVLGLPSSGEQKLKLDSAIAEAAEDVLPAGGGVGGNALSSLERAAMTSGFFFGGPASEHELKLAVVGRPNVGKSSLVNRLIGEARMVVHHLAGTTRDAISVPYTYTPPGGSAVRLLIADTAGIRRAAAGGDSREELDRMAVERARLMVSACHAALIVFDASEGLVTADLKVADLVTKNFKSAVILANKVDRLTPREREQLPGLLAERLPGLKYAPLVQGSALYGEGIAEAMELVAEAARWRALRVPVRPLNELFKRAQILRPLPYVRAAKMEQAGRFKVLYVLQAPTEAPTFVFHMNRAGNLHKSDVHWLENTLRSQWAFTGTPLRFVFRVRDIRRRRREKETRFNYNPKRAKTRNVKGKLERMRERNAIAESKWTMTNW